jgi:hypothetical protein
MKIKSALVVIAIATLLVGCGSSSAEGDLAIQTVKDRYEVDCLSKLGDDISYRYEKWTELDGTNREGTVLASVGGDTIEFSVGPLPNGGLFTVAVDGFSLETLESVCEVL